MVSWIIRTGGSKSAMCYGGRTSAYYRKFLLPVWIGRAKVVNYESKEETYTPEAANGEAAQQLQKYEKKLLEDNLKILKTNITTRITGQSCITRGTIQVVEQIGKEQVIKEKDTKIR